MEKALIYNDTVSGTATCLESSGEEIDSMVEDVGRNIDDWPSDLGIFERGHGLLIWEGEIKTTESDCEMEGKLRRLNPQELSKITDGETLWEH